MERRRLFFDIEVSPNVGLFWKAGYKEVIPAENILRERAVICIAYKWEQERKVHCLTWDENQDDKKMLQEFVRIAATATEVIGHNGDRFDMRWLRTRCLYHGIEMMPGIVTIDTLKASRSLFLFNSNRLDYIAKFLGLGGKIKTEYSLWKDILLNKDERSLRKMVRYCKNDVLLLQEVFSRMKNHLQVKQHHGVIDGLDRGSCPECGSYNLIIRTRRTTAMGYIKNQYKCNDCGKHHYKPTQR